jgi:hypothetical protein
MGSIGLREARGVEAPKASGPDFTVVTVPQASPSNVGGRGAELGVPVAEVDKVTHRVVVFPQVPQPVQAPLLSRYTWKLLPP